MWINPSRMRTIQVLYGSGGRFDTLVTRRIIVHKKCCIYKLLAHIIRLRAHHPAHLIKSIRPDNAGEFT